MRMRIIGLLTLLNMSVGLSASTFTIASNVDQFTTEIVGVHNQMRKQHHAPPLHWDLTLQKYAAQHASHCVFKHSDSPYGENLAAGYPTATAAIRAWYAEEKDYRYFWPGFSHRTGHFTQVVWVSSSTIGCASVQCDGRNGTPGKFLVCEYSPAGNITNDGYFRRNVLPQ